MMHRISLCSRLHSNGNLFYSSDFFFDLASCALSEMHGGEWGTRGVAGEAGKLIQREQQRKRGGGMQSLPAISFLSSSRSPNSTIDSHRLSRPPGTARNSRRSFDEIFHLFRQGATLVEIDF